MNDDKEPQGNPWIKSAMIWAGVIVALLLFVSIFDSPRGAGAGTGIAYSEFRQKVQDGQVKEVAVAPDRITGTLTNDQRFSTTPVTDPGLPALLDDYGVKYSGQAEEGPSFWQIMLYQSLPFILILGIAFFVLRQMQKGGGAGGAMGFGKSKAKLLTEKHGPVTFQDVAGIDEAREELEEIVEFLKDPTKFARLGGKIPKGALLVGSPGTGKTLLARAIAGEAGVPFFTISGSDFVDEHDAGRVAFRLFEHVADAAGADADKHFDEVRTRDGEEGDACLTRDRAGQQRLAGAGRTDEQCALRNLAAEFREFGRVAQELDDFFQLFAGFVDPRDIVERDAALLFGEHLCARLAEAHRARTIVLLNLAED